MSGASAAVEGSMIIWTHFWIVIFSNLTRNGLKPFKIHVFSNLALGINVPELLFKVFLDVDVVRVDGVGMRAGGRCLIFIQILIRFNSFLLSLYGFKLFLTDLLF